VNLYLLRHGIAVEHGAPGYRNNDDARPLTPEGTKKMRLIAKTLRQRKLELDLLLTSPLPRALQTAQIVAQVFEAKKKLRIWDELAVDGDPKAVIRLLRQHHSSAENVMLVGHEPYLSELISVLLSGRADMPITLKKGGLCKLSVTDLRYGRCATLALLATPHILIG